MKTFQTNRCLPYSCEYLFNLVKDVEHYSYFLPWCTGAKIISKVSDNIFYARLNIGYELLQSSYVSKVMLNPYQSIDVQQQEGPFKILTNRWVFEPIGDHHTQIQFFLSFELKSSLFNRALCAFFSKASITMIDAFENRARSLNLEKL